MRVFIYEAICAGTLGADVPPSLLREGRAMLVAVADDFAHIAGVEVVTLLSERMQAPVGNLCVRCNDNNELEHFRELAGKCDWTLVIAPEIDLMLWERGSLVPQCGGHLLGSMPDAIRLTGDKLLLAAHWHERGVMHPRTAEFDPVDFASFPPPWVVKPRFGAGSQATFLIRNRAEADRVWAPAFHECPDSEFIVQEYVRGQPASVALLIGKHQTIPLMPARQHLSQDGRFHYLGGSLPLPPALAERAGKVALEAVAGIDGLRGYVGVDLVLGDTGDCVIEINPRLTTSYIGLRQMCRSNLAELMLQCARGDTMEAPQWEEREVQFKAG